MLLHRWAVASLLILVVAGDSCFCPASCLANEHFCMNSEGGQVISSPDPFTNQCDKCLPGYKGASCEQCTSDTQCPNKGEVCSTSGSLHSSQVAYQQCNLYDSDIIALLTPKNHDVGGMVQITWSKHTNWTNDKADGSMHFKFFQIIQESDYYHNYFKCSAVNCKMTTAIRNNGEGPLHDKIRRELSTDGGSGSSHQEPDAQASRELSTRSLAIGVMIACEAVGLLVLGFIGNIVFKRNGVMLGTFLLSTTLLALILSNTLDMYSQERAIRGTSVENNGTYIEVTYRCENPECSCSPPDNSYNGRLGPECPNSPFSADIKGLKDSVYFICENGTNGKYGGPDGFGLQNPCIFKGEDLLGGEPILLGCQTTQCTNNFEEMAVLGATSSGNAEQITIAIAVICSVLAFVGFHFVYSMWVARRDMADWRSRFLTAGEPEFQAASPSYSLQETGEASAVVANGIRLSARLLSYSIGSGRSAKKILNKITLEVPPGEAMALMGPSGAGKTTLLDLLAGRDKSGIITGSILVNGETVVGGRLRQKELYKDIIGYVSQEDTLIPSLTVMECIMYSARLRLPAGMPDKVKKAKAEDVIASLGLTHCKDSKIGGLRSRGISGGERRRVSIGMELVANPRVLFLDEPTSGLDSYNALVVMKTISNLKTAGCTTQYASFFNYQPAIVFSIHQPSKEIFDTFDNLLLLSEGNLLYCGPASSVLDTCGRLGYKPPEGTTNPSDYLLKVASTLSSHERSMLASAAIARLGTLRGLDNDTLHMMDMNASDTSSIGSCHSLVMNDSLNSVPQLTCDVPDGVPSPLVQAKVNRKYYPNFYQELQIVLGRGYRSLIGSYHLVMGHIVVTILLCLILMGFYSREPLSLPGVLNRAGSLSFTMLLLGFSSLSALELFVVERDVYVREKTNKYYGSLSYFLSKILFDVIPLRIIPPLILGSLTYNQMGMRTDDPSHFLLFLVVLVLFNVITAGISFFAALVTPSFGSGVLFAALNLLLFFAFNPLIVQGSTLPSYVSWYKFASPFFLALEVLLVNELKGQHCTFAPTSASGEPSDHPIPLACEQYLLNLSLDLDRVNLDLALLIFYSFFYYFISWVALVLVVREKR
eukprot:TRINITY_DN433_c0_g3_i1.p1 TRINITY_DN433_c0_g3~~TRINITY_DN433_c0_g3_i1.p1  ORF type:complete len:1105 (+),score=242.64 TRINITY_DN433_c0_g3_i1:46-3360(+)